MIDGMDEGGISPVADGFHIFPVDHVFARYDLMRCGWGAYGIHGVIIFTCFNSYLNFSIYENISFCTEPISSFNVLAFQSTYAFMRLTIPRSTLFPSSQVCHKQTRVEGS